MAIRSDGTGDVKGYYIRPGARLSGVNFNNADLERANLEGADLTGVSLLNAKLYRAKLRGAKLININLSYADLSGANLRGSNLGVANFSKPDKDNPYGAKLIAADLRDADFSGSDLFGARLSDTILSGLDLSGLDMRGAYLDRARLAGTNLEDSDLRGAYLVGACLPNANFKGAKLDGANLSKTCLKYSCNYSPDFIKLEQTFIREQYGNYIPSEDYDGEGIPPNFEGATLKGAFISGATLVGANFTNADLTDADLTNSDLSGANLTGANLTGADIRNLNLDGAILTGAILPPGRPTAFRSYGVMTGPILKMSKPGSPARAAEFKKKYPAEFERLKSDMGGRDFSETLRESLRDKYRTPFDWVITRGFYTGYKQRYSLCKNNFAIFNVNIEAPEYTSRQRDLLLRLSYVAKERNHPFSISPLFAVGWIRYNKDDERGVFLIEEVQSDVKGIESWFGNPARENFLLHLTKLQPENLGELAEIIGMLKQYASRVYEDAIGLIYQEAEARHTLSVLNRRR